ncbi:hypothetical protein [Burkholderia gladioli]|uniref:hypothetical protein n=1 Tax=Burkholderia gladioli TaxID=28095 RepID=UPI00163E9241|nr:hypothetical protein [Burkholderia gladioli]
MHSQPVKFFWISEESEIFVATSFAQILTDAGACGTGINSVVDGVPLDSDGAPIEWGEVDGNVRTTIVELDRRERVLGTLNASLRDIYERTDGGRYSLPNMLLTQYF